MSVFGRSNSTPIGRLPLVRTWLTDIVVVFLKRADGIAEIDAVTNELMNLRNDLGHEPAATITRTINNYCINSGDTDGKATHPLFERLRPATYRLLTFPNAPDLIEIQNVLFADAAYQKTWDDFCQRAKKQYRDRWALMSKAERLTAFSKALESNTSIQSLLRLHQASGRFNLEDLPT